jgi:hypothetical protein
MQATSYILQRLVQELPPKNTRILEAVFTMLVSRVQDRRQDHHQDHRQDRRQDHRRQKICCVNSVLCAKIETTMKATSYIIQRIVQELPPKNMRLLEAVFTMLVSRAHKKMATNPPLPAVCLLS